MEEKRVLKSFEVIEKESSIGSVYYALSVKTFMGKEAVLFLSESQKELIDLVGIDNCFVDIETRVSKDNKKPYQVVALHISDEEIYDFFPRDRAFCKLAELQYKKHLEDSNKSEKATK